MLGKGFVDLLRKFESFKSCQIEGIYPKEWTFSDFLLHELKQKQKEMRKTKRQNKLQLLKL